jgi:hypothetical protein
MGAPEPINPYAPPSVAPPAGGRRPRSGAWIKWLYAGVSACVAVSYALFSLGVLLPLDPSWAGWIGEVFTWAPRVVGLGWLYATWSAVLPADRLIHGGNTVSPLGAVGRHFIPIYNIFWLLTCQYYLCRAINHALRRAPAHVDRAPIPLATAIVPIHFAVGFLSNRIPPRSVVAPFASSVHVVLTAVAWLVYMFLCDRAIAGIPRRAGARRST